GRPSVPPAPTVKATGDPAGVSGFLAAPAREETGAKEPGGSPRGAPDHLGFGAVTGPGWPGRRRCTVESQGLSAVMTAWGGAPLRGAARTVGRGRRTRPLGRRRPDDAPS